MRSDWGTCTYVHLYSFVQFCVPKTDLSSIHCAKLIINYNCWYFWKSNLYQSTNEIDMMTPLQGRLLLKLGALAVFPKCKKTPRRVAEYKILFLKNRNYLKCNFPLSPHVCLLVGWLVSLSVIISWRQGSYTFILLSGHLSILLLHRVRVRKLAVAD